MQCSVLAESNRYDALCPGLLACRFLSNYACILCMHTVPGMETLMFVVPGGGSSDVAAAPDFVTSQQHLRQVAGWSESLAVLRRAVAELGPFDGVLGFSQV